MVPIGIEEPEEIVSIYAHHRSRTRHQRIPARTVTSFKDSLTNLSRRLIGKPPIERERFKALDDVSFTVEEGEVVGIIGHNGASMFLTCIDR